MALERTWTPRVEAQRLHETLPHILAHPPFLIQPVCAQFGLQVDVWSFPTSISGCLITDNGYYYLAVNAQHSRNRRRFSAAHELYHYLEHRHLMPNLVCTSHPDPRISNLEQEADAFAAELLMPRHWVRQAVAGGIRRVGFLARHFGVSVTAMDKRIVELGLRREMR